MRYEPNYAEQLSLITRAIRFANDLPRAKNAQKWTARQYRLLRVLPPRAPYFIDNLGMVYGRKGKELVALIEISKQASPSACKTWWDRLRVVLNDICGDSSAIPDSVRPRTKPVEKDSRVLKDESIPREFWQRNMLQGHRVEKTSQNIIAPTIDAFIELVATLLADKRWRGRISKCRQCSKFFITAKRRGGRRPRVCGPACARKRGDPNRAKRQKEWRDRQHDRAI